MNFNNNKGVLLIQPKATKYNGFRAPLNLLQLASKLIDNNIFVKIVDFHIKSVSNHDLREYLESSFMVGISAFTGLQSSEAINIAKIIKIIKPTMPIIWGGYHPSIWSNLAKESNLVNYIINGIGEYSLYELASRLRENVRPENIIIEGIKKEIIPRPSMELIEPNNYLRETILANRVANVNTSYGCTHECSFCAVSNVFKRIWISKTPAQVLEEVEYLVSKWKITGLEISDNAPFIDKERMIKIAIDFIKKGFNISWMSMARADELNDLSNEEWKILVKSGFKRVFVGIESGDANVLNRIEKNQTKDQYIIFAENCAKYGVVPDYSLTIGYPPDPITDINQSFDLINKLKKITPSGTIMLYRFTPYMQDLKNEINYEFPKTWEEWAEPPWDSYTLTSANHPWLHADHKKRIRDFETVLTCAHHCDEGIFPSRGNCSWLLGIMLPIAKYRWENRIYTSPWELRMLRRLFIAANKESKKEGIAT